MNAVVTTNEKQLPEPVSRRGLNESQWLTLKNSLFPGADSNSILMVVDYCKARGLDPLKKTVHIVPMSVRDSKTGDYAYRDVVMPGIYEYRTTAARTGLYMGHSKPEYGPITEFLGMKVPEFCEMTIYRWNALASQKVEFPIRVYFAECADGGEVNRHLPMIRARVLDALRTPIETRWTDNSMPVLDWAKYDKPAVFRRLSIYITRKKLERRRG